MAVDLVKLFKEKLGDKWNDEFADVLDGISKDFLPNDGSYVPKDRFDQVNNAKKEALAELQKIKLEHMTDEEKKKALEEQYQTKLKELQAKVNKSEVEKVFAEAGMKDYDRFLDNIVSDDLDSSLEMAKSIAETFKENTAAMQKELEMLKLKSTPSPNQQIENGNGFKKLTYTEQTKLYNTDKEAYEKYIAEEAQYNQSQQQQAAQQKTAL